ncbi:epoxide hydrolase [Artemisia annua]|uniref:Epoxide hydrolase n=1 Tax=Artemisia annua TaxID=35608 RepID=A0A2U1MGT5_ARTAN|nr:epoxide hydrolase [Artemisia annua]
MSTERKIIAPHTHKKMSTESHHSSQHSTHYTHKNTPHVSLSHTLHLSINTHIYFNPDNQLFKIFYLNLLLKKQTKMEGIEHKTISANGLNMHIAQKGQGPLVLFIHGFPELWYSWRHQIVYLADHGYRAVAPDLRGYGETTGAPLNDITKFTIHHLVGDMIGLIDAIASEGEKVFVVGHDWGAIIAWHLCISLSFDWLKDVVKRIVAPLSTLRFYFQVAVLVG